MTTTRTDTHELAAERERLTERFVLMQSELGGLFYEMAIRDHLQLDLLVERAAAMQRLEAELRDVEQRLATELRAAEQRPEAELTNAEQRLEADGQ